MKKIRVAQATLVFGIAGVVLISLPGLRWPVGADGAKGLILAGGRIEGREVSVGTKLAGRIRAVQVKEGQEVKSGDLLVELEPDDIQATRDQTQAAVAQAQHSLQSAQEQVIRAKADLEKAKVALELTKQEAELGVHKAEAAVKEGEAAVQQAQAMLDKVKLEYDHAQELRKKGAATEMEFSIAQSTLRAQQAAVAMAEKRLEQVKEEHQAVLARRAQVQMRQYDLAAAESAVRQSDSAVGIAQAQLQAAEATLKAIDLRLQDTRICAPCDGVVTIRVVEPGEVVGAGSTVAIVVNFDRLYLKAYLANELVGKVRLGDPAQVYLDAYPDRVFAGTVTRVSDQAEFTPKNVDTPQERVRLVFGLEVQVENPDRLAKPGMTGDVVVKFDPQAAWKKPAELR